MIYTNLTKKAMNIAYNAHKDKYDKGGVPYIIHPLCIAEKMEDEKTTVAALLHDVVEDTELTFDDLKKEGIPEDIIEALIYLTRNKNDDYMEYINKIKCNDIACAVKKEDIIHNSDITRLNNISEKDIKRIEKYKKALEILNKKPDL